MGWGEWLEIWRVKLISTQVLVEVGVDLGNNFIYKLKMAAITIVHRAMKTSLMELFVIFQQWTLMRIEHPIMALDFCLM